MHGRLVEALAPVPGERWLDLATGTGEVALRAARAGAQVTALDIAEPMLRAARQKAEAENLSIDFMLGDAQALPLADGAFDVVSSSVGIIFAPDREAVARQLARVCRHGGRIGLTAWRPRADHVAIYERFRTGPGRPDQTEWGVDGFVEGLLGADFELELDEGTWVLDGDSADDVFEFMATNAPPMVAFLGELPPERREPFRAAFVEYWGGFAGEDGRVREPWSYRLVVGRRR